MIPWTPLLIAFLMAFAAASLCREWLRLLNCRHLRRRGSRVPPVFADAIDAATLARMADYTVASSRFAAWEALWEDALTLVILLSGVLPWLAGLILEARLSFVWSGLLFFGTLAGLSGASGIPFSLYGTFVIERRYGFSTITFRLWLTDLLKGLLLSSFLMGILLGAFLVLLKADRGFWWFWAWLFFAAFQFFLLWIYPVVLAPLFNRYTPIPDEALRGAATAMMAAAGLETKGVYQVDAGQRSRHTNAYFTGFGRTKRIVLYDTLLDSHSAAEILSILAHEIGHWQGRHVLKQLLFMEGASLAVFYAAYRLLDWPLLYQAFGLNQPVPYVGLFLLTVLAGPLAFFLTPAASAVLRRFEREADDAAHALTGTSKPLCDALRRLAKDNLANLYPHPLYAWFYYSHPPLAERIERLEGMDDLNV